MKRAVCCAVLLVLLAAASAQGPDAAGNEAGTAADQRRRRSPSPAPASPSPSPAAGIEASPAPAGDNATAAAASSPEPAAAGVEASPAPGDATAAAAAGPTAGADAANATAPTAEEPAAGANATAGAEGTTPKAKTNIADKRIKAFYETPEGATKALPQLKELNKLIAASPAVSKALKDKNLVATIFAPNNDAVKAALAYLNETQPGVDAKTLQEAGVLEGLLQYHVTAGNAALTADRLKNGMKLTMLNKEPTTIFVGANGTRRLLQDGAVSIASNSGQKFAVNDANYQGGKAIIHVIDGVLIPKSMVENFNLTSLPGSTPESMAAAAAAGNDTSANATEPAAAGEGAAGAGGATKGAGAGEAPAPAGAPAPKKSSAGTAAATLLAVPTLLALLML